MSQESQKELFVKRRVVYQVPGMHAVTVHKDLSFAGADGEPLAMDVYSPPGRCANTLLPAVVFVSGYPDPGVQKIFGCVAKEIGAYVSWGELVAASGLIGITYRNRTPVEDVPALLGHLRREAAALGIDQARLALWACSGNVPTALGVLMQEPPGALCCAALSYGYMLDFAGFSGVAEASRTFGFAATAAGRTVGDLPGDLPMFVARAGRDEMPGLNESLDHFVAEALAANLPLTVLNHHVGPHAFDTAEDSDRSRAAVKQLLDFLRCHLRAGS